MERLVLQQCRHARSLAYLRRRSMDACVRRHATRSLHVTARASASPPRGLGLSLTHLLREPRRTVTSPRIRSPIVESHFRSMTVSPEPAVSVDRLVKKYKS